MSEADTEKGKRELLRKEVEPLQSKVDQRGRRDLLKGARKSYKNEIDDDELRHPFEQDDDEDEEGKDINKQDKVELEDDDLRKHVKEKEALHIKNTNMQ